MDPEKIAHWMKSEHAAVDRLAEELRRQIAAVPAEAHRSKWWEELRGRYDHFRAHMIKHMSLEEKDGYLAVVRERRPSLESQVIALQREHHQLTAIMKRIDEEMDAAGVNDLLLLRDCCSRISCVIDYIDRHEDCENLMVMSVFTDEIGTKD